MKPITDEMRQASVETQAEACFSKICKSLIYCEQSSKKLRYKLKFAGFREEAIEMAISKAILLNLINDERYCNNLLRRNFKSRYKAYAILYEIESLGFDPNYLDNYTIFHDRLQKLDSYN